MKRIANHSTGIEEVPDKLRCRKEIRPEALFSSFPAGAPGELRQPVVRLSAVPLNRSAVCRAFAPRRIPVSHSTPRDQKTGSASGATPAHREVPRTQTKYVLCSHDGCGTQPRDLVQRAC